MVNIGDSISVGLITNGELFRAPRFANAIGHHTINFDEPAQCSCGKYGCWEQYCSNGAVIAYANTVLPQPISTLEELITLIRHQDPLARQVMDRFLTYLAVGLTNIIFIFDCQAIAISSELLSALPYYLPEVMRKMVLPITHVEKGGALPAGEKRGYFGGGQPGGVPVFPGHRPRHGTGPVKRSQTGRAVAYRQQPLSIRMDPARSKPRIVALNRKAACGGDRRSGHCGCGWRASGCGGGPGW